MGPYSHHLHRVVSKVGKDGSHQCDYHGGNPGYPTKNCTALKYKVRDLINKGKLKFEDLDGSVEVEDSSRIKVEVPKQEEETLKQARQFPRKLQCQRRRCLLSRSEKTKQAPHRPLKG